MLLLIIPKNGAHRKTYGVDSLNFGNMKYPFWCFVIVLICSYSASGDMDLYPDSKYYIPNQRSESYDNPFSNKKWRYRNLSPLEDYEQNINKAFASNYDLRNPDVDIPPSPSHNSLDGILKFLYEKHNRALLPDITNKRIETQRLLHNAMPFENVDSDSDQDEYVDEENDGIEQKWLDEEIERNTQAILKKLQENSRKKITDHLRKTIQDDPIIETTDSEEGKLKKYDSTTFAFVPPDPRYYESQSEPIISETESQPVSSSMALPIVPILPKSIEGTNTQKTIEIPYRRDTNFGTTRKHIVQDPLTGRSTEVVVHPKITDNDAAGVYIIAIVAGISAAATVGLIAIGIGWYNLQKHVKNASDVEYPAYGVTGPNKDVSPSNDRRLAQSAQMYHYQHQKQQIIAMEKAATGERHGSVSEADTDEENEEGDYTVYECPGLAPTGEMEVKNPMYQDDPTPAQTPQVKQGNRE